MIFIFGGILSWNIDLSGDDIDISIDKNDSVNKIALQLQDKIDLNPLLFKIALKLTFNDKNIKYGRYDLKSVVTLRDLIELFNYPLITIKRIQEAPVKFQANN